MIRHFWLDKTNSIVKGTDLNCGLNPVLKLNYGKKVSRGLIHFNLDEIKKLYEDKTITDPDSVKFRLRMTNCFSVDGIPYENELLNKKPYRTRRPSSFDLILYELPCPFDAGRGYMYESDYYVERDHSFIRTASNWYYPENGKVWPFDLERALPKDFDVREEGWDNYSAMINWENAIYKFNLVGGIYDINEIESALTAYECGETSIIVGMQHFDYGFENLDIDITDYVNALLNGEKENYGLCLSFVPELEQMKFKDQYHVAFFTDHTNTFFHPYVEVEYDDTIMDDRQAFYLGKENRLYFYSYVGGIPTNLDELPVCKIDGKEYEVKQATKGVYFATVMFGASEVEPNTILYDMWSNLKINGNNMGTMENEFVALSHKGYITLGMNTEFDDEVVPTITGIYDSENLHRGEIRVVIVDFRKKYTTDKKLLIDSGEYRIYTLDGTREIEVFEYQPIQKSFINNFFTVYTKDLIPGTYHVDIKVNRSNNTQYYKDILSFKVVSDVTDRHP